MRAPPTLFCLRIFTNLRIDEGELDDEIIYGVILVSGEIKGVWLYDCWSFNVNIFVLGHVVGVVSGFGGGLKA